MGFSTSNFPCQLSQPHTHRPDSTLVQSMTEKLLSRHFLIIFTELSGNPWSSDVTEFFVIIEYIHSFNSQIQLYNFLYPVYIIERCYTLINFIIFSEHCTSRDKLFHN